MRKRIWRMSEDKFENQRQSVSFSRDMVQVEGQAGESLRGDFVIYSGDGIRLRGLVYSSNPYVTLLNPQFQGTEACIRFEVLGQDYREGDHLSGYFTIVCNQGEYRLPFAVEFKHKKLLCSRGEITTLEDFLALAREHWNEAMKLFYSTAFAAFIKRQPMDCQLLYQGFSKALPCSANLEEFLVAAGLKEPVSYQVEETSENFYEVTENRKEAIHISKSTWGYIELRVSSDQDFVTVEKELVNSDYFLGSTLTLNYYIHKERMHGGKNYACIRIIGKGKEHVIHLMATSYKEDYRLLRKKQPRHKLLANLTQLYVDYRLRRKTTGDWCRESVDVLELLLRMEDLPWYRLMKAQCYIINKQRQEALWLISDLKKEIADKSSVEWAYLLYLCTLLEQETGYVDRLTREIEGLFRQHPEDGRIFWFLLFLREEYFQNGSQKLKDIEQWLMAGYSSPFFYIEALAAYEHDPYLLREFTPETIRILLWVTRRHAFSVELAMQVAHVLSNTGFFDQRIWRIAQEAYQVIYAFQEKKEPDMPVPYTHEKFLTVMISYLLRCQQYGEQYLVWYREGIGAKLRLNGIYEAFMMSLPDYSLDALPEILLLYFQYHCSLPDQKKALLYANVITHRDKIPRLYQQYMRQMEEFAYAQMRQGHINDNLAILYQNILQVGILDETIAQEAAGMIYMRKIVTIHPEVTRIFVYQQQYRMPVIVPVEQNQAYVSVVSRNYRLFLETNRGEMLCDPDMYVMQRIMYPESYLSRLKKLAPCALPFVLTDLERKSKVSELSLDELPAIETLIHSPVVSPAYRTSMYPSIAVLLQKHCRENLLEQHFMEEVDYSSLDAHTRSYIIGLFISGEHYEQAYAMVKQYAAVDVDGRLLLRLVEYQIGATEYGENEFLLSLAGFLLEQGLVSAVTVSYLRHNYVGPTLQMIALWKHAKRLDISVPELEENILFQALYAESHLADTEDIFASYRIRGRDKMLLEAYLNYWSHAYMLGEKKVPQCVFQDLERNYNRGLPLKESASLAYLKYLSSKEELSQEEYQAQDQLLNRYIRRNMYFGFYRNMDIRLIVKYQLYDKQFVEYHGTPGDKVTITYDLGDGQVHREAMIEMYEGIFVKQFILFLGERITYAFSAASGSGDDLSVPRQLMLSDIPEQGHKDRFDRLNRLQSQLYYGSSTAINEELKDYYRMDEVTRVLFTLV